GGGLAGLAAAVALLEPSGRAPAPDGPSVELFERRGVLGGRAASSPGEDGALVDNCQHVLMRCCTNLWDFYGRLGVQSRIRFVRRLNFLRRDGRLATLSAAGGRPFDTLPAPLHLAPSFLRFGALGPVDRLRVARALLGMARTPPKQIAAL